MTPNDADTNNVKGVIKDVSNNKGSLTFSTLLFNI